MNTKNQQPIVIGMAVLCSSVLLALIVFVSTARGAEPKPNIVEGNPSFYKGKTVRLIVGHGAGNSFDLVGRLVARHISKHIPGNPTVIVQNMPGGGNLLAPNYVYGVAKPDGLTFGLSNSAIAMDQIIGNKAVQFDIERFRWIGSASQEVRLAFMRKDTPYQNIEALRTAAKAPRIGYSGVGSGFYQMSRLIESALGIKLDLIPGFQGESPIKLAVERGDLDGMIGIGQGGVLRGMSEWLKTGFITLLIQTGVWDVETESFKRHPDFPSVPTIWELAPSEKKPIVKAALLPITPVRIFYMAPQVPSDLVKTLQNAFWATMNDPAYKAEVPKILGSSQENLYPVNGERLQKILTDSKNLPAELIDQLKKIYGA